MTGGTFVDPQDRPAGIRGGEERQIGPGDFVVIPAGVPHWFSRIDGVDHVREHSTRTGRSVVRFLARGSPIAARQPRSRPGTSIDSV